MGIGKGVLERGYWLQPRHWSKGTSLHPSVRPTISFLQQEERSGEGSDPFNFGGGGNNPTGNNL